MSRRMRMQTLIYSLIFGAVSVILLLYASTHRLQVIPTVEDRETGFAEPEQDFRIIQYQLKFEKNSEEMSSLIIPLPEATDIKQLEIENCYMEQKFLVFLDRADVNFFRNHPVSGNLESVLSGSVKEARGGVCLEFLLSDILECKSILENDTLCLTFVSPREVYDRIVVLDAGCGGDDDGFQSSYITEKEITLDLVRRVKELLDETDIKAYCTRLDDKNPSGEARIRIANKVDADMFISLHASFDKKDSRKYGTEIYYSDSFFMPDLDGAKLGDLVEKEVVTKINGKGRGLFSAGETCYEIQNATVPAVQLNVGYLSNQQETLLLQKKEYRQKIAEGIYNAIVLAYEEQE